MYQDFLSFHCWTIFYCIDTHFIHSSVDGHLGCFHVGAITNNAAVNVCVQILNKFVWTYVFISLGCGIAGWYDNYMFNLLRSCQIIFLSDCTILHPSSPVWEFQFPHILANAIVSLSVLATLVCVKWCLVVVGCEPFVRSMGLGKGARVGGREEETRSKGIEVEIPLPLHVDFTCWSPVILVRTEDPCREIAREETRKLQQRGNCT